MSTIIRTDIDTTTNKDTFKTLVYSWWDSTDREALSEWRNVCLDLKSNDDYERLGRKALLGYGAEVKEGEPIPLQTIPEPAVKDLTQESFGTSFRITDRMKRYEKIGLYEDLVKNLRVMQEETKDTEIAKMWNNATSTTYASGFDDLAIASDSHTCKDDAGTTYDNYGDSALAVSSIEDALNYFDYLYDDQGHIWTATPETLVVNKTLRWDAMELLKSTGKPWEMSNTLNAIQGELTPFVYHRLTSDTAWFVIAKNHPKYQYVVITTVEPEVRVESAPDTTWDTIVSSLQYFKYGVGDPRLAYFGDT